jgi:FtsH-binding integral membrane protein
MDHEKAGIIIVGILVFTALIVVGTSNITGNAIMDAGSATSPVLGAALLVLFIVAAFLVIRALLPESAFHE